GASNAEAALRGALKPHGLEADPDGRKDGDVQDRQEVFRKIFLSVKFNSDAPETEVDDTSAARTLVAERGIGICAAHGDAFRLALHCVNSGRRSLRRHGRLLRNGSLGWCGFGFKALWDAPRFN